MARKYAEERPDYMDENERKALGERIKAIRTESGLTQGEFAAKLSGISAVTISTAESGKTKPSNTILDNICTTYIVNKEWLLTGEGEMHPSAEDYEMTKALNMVANGTDAQKTLIRFIANMDEKLLESLVDYAKEFLKE